MHDHVYAIVDTGGHVGEPRTPQPQCLDSL